MGAQSARDIVTCPCRCGYTCEGRGICLAEFEECLRDHYKTDCTHVWDGPVIETDTMGCKGPSVTCSVCTTVKLAHDLFFGP